MAKVVQGEGENHLKSYLNMEGFILSTRQSLYWDSGWEASMWFLTVAAWLPHKTLNEFGNIHVITSAIIIISLQVTDFDPGNHKRMLMSYWKKSMWAALSWFWHIWHIIYLRA